MFSSIDHNKILASNGLLAVCWFVCSPLGHISCQFITHAWVLLAARATTAAFLVGFLTHDSVFLLGHVSAPAKVHKIVRPSLPFSRVIIRPTPMPLALAIVLAVCGFGSSSRHGAAAPLRSAVAAAIGATLKVTLCDIATKESQPR